MPLRESDPLAPLSRLRRGEMRARARLHASAALNGGVRVIWARAFNHVGPGQGPDAPVAQWARQVAEAELAGGGTLRTGALDVVRDFLDVRDVADAYLALVRSPAEGAVNVCSGEPTPLSRSSTCSSTSRPSRSSSSATRRSCGASIRRSSSATPAACAG